MSADNNSTGYDEFNRWRIWLERGTWFVLIAGVIGVSASTLADIALSLEAAGPLSLRLQFRFWSGRVSRGLFDISLVVALFLVLRLLILGIPALLELRDAVVADDEAEESTAEEE